MYNMPDGCREDDIPGYWAEDVQVECGVEHEFSVLTRKFVKEARFGFSVMNHVDTFTDGPGDWKHRYERLLGQLENVLEHGEKVLAECPWEGEVELEPGDRKWDCPVCGTVHEIEFDPEGF